MNRIIKWLSEHKIINFILLLGYYIAVVLPHKSFGRFLNQKVFKGITRAEYNQMVLMGALVALGGFAAWFYYNSRSHAKRKWLYGYLGLNVLFAFLIMSFLFVINIEVVHFPQYALFAILVFPLLGNYQQALIWTIFAGALDEAHQYFYLAPKDTFYYDFNDVVTNLVGAVFGLLFIWSFSIKEWRTPRFIQSTGFMAICVLVLMVVLACLSGVLNIYPSEDTSYQLLRRWPESFWSTVPPQVTYHIMRPLEGTVATILMTLVFFRIGKE